VKGKIKFLDTKTGKWGFIVPDDSDGGDVHFQVQDFVDQYPAADDAGQAVEFDIEVTGQSRHAKNIRLGTSGVSRTTPRASSNPGNALKQWAYVPFVPFTHRDGTEYSSVLEYLAQIALHEKWHFGELPNPKNAYPILDNYLTYTFYKLKKEGLVLEIKGSEGAWATFNTGLVDKLYDPIFALFKRSDYPSPPWRFFDFCVPGKREAGRRLTSVFDPLPEAARYFDTSFAMVLDTARDIHVDYEHVIFDGVSRDRFPYAFLEHYVPKGFEWQRYPDMEAWDRKSFLERLSASIENDVQCTRSIKRRLEDAKLLAEKRTKWNFKTAIPQYYPRYNTMSLLLPLAIVDDEVVDIALVVTKNPSGSYQGRTILPLDWAYQNARLVCRPDSDWLVPGLIRDVDTLGEASEEEIAGDSSREVTTPANASLPHP
jgi:cold shock CspA family protein